MIIYTRVVKKDKENFTNKEVLYHISLYPSNKYPKATIGGKELGGWRYDHDGKGPVK